MNVPLADGAGEPGRPETFERITQDILAELSRQDLCRERALSLSRGIIRSAALTIRAVHRAEFDQAAGLLEKARQDLAQLHEIVLACPLFAAIGYVADAQKEYAEACITHALLRGDPWPHPDDLRVPVAPYLNALGETAGELRRSILDALRQDTVGPCEERLEIMQQIFDFLSTVDFADALTGGLRRTTDNVRRILENTRADMTTALRQRALQQSLERLERQLPLS